MRLIPSPPARIVSGRIMFDGEDVVALDEARLRALRGNAMAMIYQDPMTTLNPVFTVGEQIAEAVRLHRDASRAAALARAVEMLELVGIPDPARCAQSYPHQLSGGMRQRAVIAMALACHPKLLIADEPTTALDVTIQAQILDLMRRLQQELGTAIILITHDLGVIADLVDTVVVMYAGKVVERAPVKRLFAAPRHPYTQGLLRSVPSLETREHRMRTIEGTVPSAFAMPQGCRFHPRCALAREICRNEEPPLVQRRRRRRGGVLGAGVTPPLLQVRDLTKHFPITGGPRGHPHDRPGARGRWRVVRPRRGRDAGAGRRIRLRQVHHRPHAAAPDRADLRQHPRSAARTCSASATRALRRRRREMQIVFQDPYSSLSPRQRVEDIVAEPLDVYRLYARRGRSGASAWSNCCAWSGWMRRICAATRSSSPAASASASRSPARWRRSRG